MIGIIAAMQEEGNEVLKLMQNKKEVKFGNDKYIYTTGSLADKEVVLGIGRVAKINATISTMLLLEHFDIDLVINVGSAGGLLKGMHLLDVVVASCTAQHDLDVMQGKGVQDGQPRFIPCDESLVTKAMSILEKLELDHKIYQGLIVSGDQFIFADAASEIMHNFADAKCVEMESAAINLTCYQMGVKCLIIRSISDIPEHSEMTFEEYLPLAARNAARVCLELVSKL